MLVTLGSNATIASGASQTFQYACDTFQKIFVRCNDSGTDALKGYVTVQIGNKVICNDISFHALSKISLLNGGGKASTTDANFSVDFGSHILAPLENVYVTLRAESAMDAIDVSAIVNESGNAPIKLTNYSDHVFTDSKTIDIFAWADTSLENDTTAFTIRNQSYSSTPQVQSGVNVSLSMVQSQEAMGQEIAYMARNEVAQDTSVNYSSADIDGVVCVSQCG